MCPKRDSHIPTHTSVLPVHAYFSSERQKLQVYSNYVTPAILRKGQPWCVGSFFHKPQRNNLKMDVFYWMSEGTVAIHWKMYGLMICPPKIRDLSTDRKNMLMIYPEIQTKYINVWMDLVSTCNRSDSVISSSAIIVNGGVVKMESDRENVFLYQALIFRAVSLV